MNKEKLAKKYRRIFEKAFKKVSGLPVKITAETHEYLGCLIVEFICRSSEITETFTREFVVRKEDLYYGFVISDRTLLKESARSMSVFLEGAAKNEVINKCKNIFINEFKKRTNAPVNITVNKSGNIAFGDYGMYLDVLFSYKPDLDKRNLVELPCIIGCKNGKIKASTEMHIKALAASVVEKSRLNYVSNKKQIGEFI